MRLPTPSPPTVEIQYMEILFDLICSSFKATYFVVYLWPSWSGTYMGLIEIKGLDPGSINQEPMMCDWAMGPEFSHRKCTLITLNCAEHNLQMQ